MALDEAELPAEQFMRKLSMKDWASQQVPVLTICCLGFVVEKKMKSSHEPYYCLKTEFVELLQMATMRNEMKHMTPDEQLQFMKSQQTTIRAVQEQVQFWALCFLENVCVRTTVIS